jgi:hypothetical protein
VQRKIIAIFRSRLLKNSQTMPSAFKDETEMRPNMMESPAPPRVMTDFWTLVYQAIE